MELGEVITELCLTLDCARNSLWFSCRAKRLCLRQEESSAFLHQAGSSQKPWDEADAVQGLGQMCCTNPGASRTFPVSPDEFKMFRIEETWKKGNKARMVSCNISGTSILHEELLIPFVFPGGTTKWERRKLPAATCGFSFNNPDPHSHLPSFIFFNFFFYHLKGHQVLSSPLLISLQLERKRRIPENTSQQKDGT